MNTASKLIIVIAIIVVIGKMIQLDSENTKLKKQHIADIKAVAEAQMDKQFFVKAWSDANNEAGITRSNYNVDLKEATKTAERVYHIGLHTGVAVGWMVERRWPNSVSANQIDRLFDFAEWISTNNVGVMLVELEARKRFEQ